MRKIFSARFLSVGLGVFIAVSLLTGAAPQKAQAAETLKIGVVLFLSGAAAGPFGIPARNGVETLIAAINGGKIPAPYNTKGMAGAQIEAVYIDESGGATKQVTEFRNLVQRQKVDVVVGYISSGNCIAVAPVADELKMLTVIPICGTPRLFEDASYKYVFRTISDSITDSVGAAHYIKEKFPNARTIAGINPNYAWGQDSWRDFHLAFKLMNPDSEIVTEQFPKLFAGTFTSEISVLLRKKPDVIHSSLWGADLESFVNQAAARGLNKRSKIILTIGEANMFRLGAKMPDGIIISARGPYGVLARQTPLNDWFRAAYQDLFTAPPVYPSYMTAQAMLGLKIAYDKASQARGGGMPSTEEVVKAFEYLKYEAFGITIDMAYGNGHQAFTGTAYGQFKFDKSTGTATFTDIMWFDPECVNAPKGMKGAAWIKGGMKGAKCG
ncbi:MAG: ABC transporter substrate-binding protein [SAR324 cluster bacterium]|nr:ABC transporter substrate-binding protein [SAR324 cluster bacterium]